MARMTNTSFMTGIKNWVLGKIANIMALIPNQASSSNQLADKNFVNSSIATATATFRGTYNVVSELSLSYNATHAQIEAALVMKMAALSIVVDNNDYAFVQIPTSDATPTEIAKIEKYKYNGTAWAFEYELNNSGFTAAQWAAINSGATLELIGKLSALPTNSELTTILNGKASKAENATAGHFASLDANGNPTDSGVSLEDNGAYDVTAHNSGAKFADLSALLSNVNLNTLIPVAVRKGGMSIKFVQSSDNNYVKFFCTADEFSTDVEDWEHAASVEDLENGNVVPAMAETLEPWADQKAIATPDTYTDAVRTTGGDIPIETSAGSKLESIKPAAGSKWTAKLLFNGSYNMLNAAKWGAANSQPYVGGVGNDFVYFLVPELTLGTFGTADENNGLLFTNAQGENVEPTSVYFKPLGATVPQSLTDGTSITPTSVSYDGKTYKDYATSGAGWLIIPKTYYDNDVCAHIAWEDWYDKYVSLDEPTTNPEAVVGILMLEGLLALAHSDKYLRGINEEVCDNAIFGETSSTITHMVDELSVAANAWTNAATGESDSHGNALYRHSATVSLIKQGGAACIEGEDGGIPLTVNGTTVSYVDTNATAPASVVFYEVAATSTTKAYTDSIFNGSNIDTETGILPINDCSIEAQVAMDGEANITVKYAKNIVDQVAINATVDVPQIKKQVENHEERITELEDTAVRTGSYDASVAVGLADNFKGDTIVEAEFYKRKTGGTQSVGSGIAAIKEVRGKSIVWNQIIGNNDFTNSENFAVWASNKFAKSFNDNSMELSYDGNASLGSVMRVSSNAVVGHKYLALYMIKALTPTYCGAGHGGDNKTLVWQVGTSWDVYGYILTAKSTDKYVYVYATLGSGNKVNIRYVNMFDLTLMFGAGNEPTKAELKKIFPLDRYDYNAGEVIPFAGQNLVTTGKNQYNPATGKANLLGGQTYQIGGTYTSAEIDGVAVTLDSNDCFTTTKDCVLDVTGGNDTDTIVALYNGENVTYEPYEKHTLPLDPSQWRDKQGNLVFPYGGMFGYGSTYDYTKVDSDGYIRKAMRVYERRAYESGDVTSGNIITDGRTYTFYPLAEPIEVELATPIYAKYLVDKDGTEEITPANGTTPYTTMANLSILYAMDARGEIKNLPKNYLSKESAENMLNAMVSAGVIASYTMTYDAANARYQFTIVAPTQSNN